MDMYTANPLESKFQNSISDFMGYLFMDIFIYAPLLIILNSNFVAWLWNALTNFIFGKDVFIDENDLIEEDDFVKSEKQLVDNIFTNDASKLKRVYVLWSVHKCCTYLRRNSMQYY